MAHIISIGNSQGIILPKEVLKKLQITRGDELDMDFEDNYKVVLTKKGTKKTKPEVSRELLSWLDGFNARYKNALKELSSK